MTKQHHTEEFITQMHERLTKEKKQLEEKLSALGHKGGRGEYKPDFPDYGRQDEDNVTELADFQSFAATEMTLEQRLQDINDALERIKAKKYGITEEGDLIPEDRLRANPAATTIVTPRK